jgi:hypothetical protein
MRSSILSPSAHTTWVNEVLIEKRRKVIERRLELEFGDGCISVEGVVGEI